MLVWRDLEAFRRSLVKRFRAPSKDQDTHAYEDPGLGTIMADGGRPLEDSEWPDRDWSWADEREFEVGE